MRNLHQYLRDLPAGRLVLWCYLIWYAVMVSRYFDANPRLWITSLGISFIIGIALILSVSSNTHRPLADPWQTFRLFAMPFCVSSFAATVKDHGFILVFPPKIPEIGLGLGFCAAFCSIVGLIRVTAARNCLNQR